MADDPTIPDDAIIWRYVVPQWIVRGKDGEGSLPSPGAFEDSSDGDPMSAILASKDRDPATAVPKASPDAGVVAFTAGFLRGLGLESERAVSSPSVRCMRSCRPFCSGCPGSMRSGWIPSFIHQTDSSLSPPMPAVANGGPLSERMRNGRPYSRNARSKWTFACAVSGRSTDSHLSR